MTQPSRPRRRPKIDGPLTRHPRYLPNRRRPGTGELSVYVQSMPGDDIRRAYGSSGDEPAPYRVIARSFPFELRGPPEGNAGTYRIYDSREPVSHRGTVLLGFSDGWVVYSGTESFRASEPGACFRWWIAHRPPLDRCVRQAPRESADACTPGLLAVPHSLLRWRSRRSSARVLASVS